MVTSIAAPKFHVCFFIPGTAELRLFVHWRIKGMRDAQRNRFVYTRVLRNQHDELDGSDGEDMALFDKDMDQREQDLRALFFFGDDGVSGWVLHQFL